MKTICACVFAINFRKADILCRSEGQRTLYLTAKGREKSFPVRMRDFQVEEVEKGDYDKI